MKLHVLRSDDDTSSSSAASSSSGDSDSHTGMYVGESRLVVGALLRQPWEVCAAVDGSEHATPLTEGIAIGLVVLVGGGLGFLRYRKRKKSNTAKDAEDDGDKAKKTDEDV